MSYTHEKYVIGFMAPVVLKGEVEPEEVLLVECQHADDRNHPYRQFDPINVARKPITYDSIDAVTSHLTFRTNEKVISYNPDQNKDYYPQGRIEGSKVGIFKASMIFEEVFIKAAAPEPVM